MDEQHPPPPLEYKYSGGLRNELGTSERLSGLAIAGEGSVSAAAPFRQHQEETNATEPVEDQRKALEARNKCSHTSPCEACRKARSACVPQSERPRANRHTTICTETRTEKLPIHRAYADQPSSDTTTTYEAHANESMEGHRWSASDMGCASVITIPRENDAERDTPTTCPVDITYRGEWNAVGDDRNNTLASETGVNAGWGPPSSVIPLPNSYMPADNLTEHPTADAWYSMPRTTEPCSWETLPESFWGWTWPQSEYLAGSETDGFLHPSIPVQQSAGWPFGSEAEQPQYATRSGIMPFWVDHSQELFPLGPSPDPPEPIPSSVAARLSSMPPETRPPNIPNLYRVQQAEDVSLSIPTFVPLQLPSWDPLAPVSAALPMTDFHRRSMHQEPSAPVPVPNIESLVPPWL
ncbi:hypothetical protein AtubIFM55763_002052 [Aspergillus tubingensis]|nr:hypothetical protein AtubIFM55763_002052 [Aspergillus tubingensis]